MHKSRLSTRLVCYLGPEVSDTAASVATALESAYEPYYRMFPRPVLAAEWSGPTMNLLYEVLHNATSEEQRLLVGKAVECATLVGKSPLALCWRVTDL